MLDTARSLRAFRGSDGHIYVTVRHKLRNVALRVGSRKLQQLIRKLLEPESGLLRQADVVEIEQLLAAQAEASGEPRDVWLRVAPIEGGIELDVGDEDHKRIRVTAQGVEVDVEASSTPFFRTARTQPLVMPASVGDLKLLHQYLNMRPEQKVLLVAWITFVLAHPKCATTKYPILVVEGAQGSGKSSLCALILRLLDPSLVGIQALPWTTKDLAIAAANAHVLAFDNLRHLGHAMADALCIASTGGVITGRQLYTDGEQHVQSLHCAVVLNGIHTLVDQADLAQRCLLLRLLSMAEKARRSEAELARQLEADLPLIMRGLLDLISAIFKRLPGAQITNPERMLDFVRWIAAMELVDGVPPGTYQAVYSDVLQQGQRDSLHEHVLSAALLEFAEEMTEALWDGTPAELLDALTKRVSFATQHSRDWPRNPIAMSRRLAPMQAALLSQRVSLEFSRGKERVIRIRKVGAAA